MGARECPRRERPDSARDLQLASGVVEFATRPRNSLDERPQGGAVSVDSSLDCTSRVAQSLTSRLLQPLRGFLHDAEISVRLDVEARFDETEILLDGDVRL